MSRRGENRVCTNCCTDRPYEAKGLCSRCYFRAKAAEYRARYPERYKEAAKRYRDAHKESVRESHRTYHANNREKVREYRKVRRESNLLAHRENLEKKNRQLPKYHSATHLLSSKFNFIKAPDTCQ